ncbi:MULTISPECIES: nitrogen fixation protein NifQ [Ectothiorhodospira]|uniref:Nitrogen fixation protein NifQ n=1 Tax=Ectothiorhodospira marina TaxID=1396821 RepID=A0A1H7PWT8_9GAMM|nr:MULTISPECIES: nitrogen fixation protein NifQ [Ectothiorhodospira]MCG5516546.1 nitrogen fixation protein NifQ [Ectothiorhodospira sp. 9100]MCG5518359.1 nitrogen fixation protein NifQ [Ectothiorhodospira sp. 9905]SEL40069.1 nitrogen fixation protein NifQ [Ectothiorhodospira marina]
MASNSHPLADPNTHRRDRLLALPGRGDPFDRHVLACALAAALEDVEQSREASLNASLGLPADRLDHLLDQCFPGFDALEPEVTRDGEAGEGAIEEADLRSLLIDHVSHPGDVALWLAHIIARRALKPGHLWQGLGLDVRAQLSTLMTRHFPALADQNVHNMRWKKFFYRQLCGREGIPICKSPVCGDCPDYRACFMPDND